MLKLPRKDSYDLILVLYCVPQCVGCCKKAEKSIPDMKKQNRTKNSYSVR